MRQFTLGCLLTITLFANMSFANEKIFEGELFTIHIPKGMVIDDRDVNKISLVFENDEDLLNGTLSVAAKRLAKGTDFESKWLKVRQLIIKDKKIIYEKEEKISGLKWKVIEVEGVGGQIDFKNTAFYSAQSDILYSMHFHCITGRCDSIENVIDQIMNSFKILNNR